MKIEIKPSKYIINPSIETDDFCISDFLLRELRVDNDKKEKIKIVDLMFELFAAGKPVKKIAYSGDLLEEPVVRNEHFHVVSKLPVDTLDIKINYIQDDKMKEEKIRVHVINYKTKNEYIFPVRGGGWQVHGNYDCIGSHRIPAPASMEFAIDLGQLDSKNKVNYEWNNEKKNEDAPHYGQEIIAIGDGEVVDSYNNADWQIFPSGDTDNEWAKIGRQFGSVPQHCGNYVILKHDNDEYSFYGHMIQHSVTVEKGMRVRQGDVLGRLGNVGFSFSPHLHFHLMNAPELFEAQGLPCHFTNIVDMCGRPLSFIQEEYTIICAE